MDFTDDDVASSGLSYQDYRSYSKKIGFLIYVFFLFQSWSFLSFLICLKTTLVY